MRRKPLLLIGALFLTLCITCLFYSDYSGNMLIALAVQLVFFVRFAIFQKPPLVSEIQNDTITDVTDKEEDEQFETVAKRTEIKNMQQANSNVI